MEKADKGILIDFEPISRRFYVSTDSSIYELLKDINIPIRSICGGLGKCGKCKIRVHNGYEFLNEPTSKEKNFINEAEIQDGWRLACESKIDIKKKTAMIADKPPLIRIFLPSQLLLEDFKILTTGINKKINLSPTIEKIFLEVKEPLLEEPNADFERIEREIIPKIKNLKKNENIRLDFNILKTLPDMLRNNKHEITIILRNNRDIIACEAGNTIQSSFGIAFDIGTTTIVGYLLNLNNGKIYAVDSKLNGQTAYGEDLITRLTYIKQNEENLTKLNSIVINDLNEIISNLCHKAHITQSHVYEATVVGNTVMHHIFLGLNPVNIGLSPFVPVIQRDLNVRAKNLKLNISKNGLVYTLPIIAGFVGADTIGVILSSQIYNEKPLTLAIDIGTNGEIIIGNRNNLIVGSCAAGSALEGAHIDDGMRAAAGAIDFIKIDPSDLEVSYSTIKNKKPIGICGSGLVDGIAEMLKSKIITRSGRFNRELIDHKCFIKNDKNLKFVVAKKEETSIGKEITISQNDVRQIQMAKAAFYSGMRILLNHLSKNLNIEQVFLAGAFGNYINAQNAKFIGMIPDIDDKRIFQIGNAAGIGAQYCLLNKDLRNIAKNLLTKIKYVEIAVEKNFQKEYAEAMYFPHLNLDFFPNLKEYENIPKR